MSHWTIFSNHGHVLLYLARNPETRLRDVAEQVGITERAVQKIVKDLQDADIVSVRKHGRRNRYRVNNRKPLRHTLESHKTIGSLVRLIEKRPKQSETIDAIARPSGKNIPAGTPASLSSRTGSIVTTSAGKAEAAPVVFEASHHPEVSTQAPDKDLIPAAGYKGDQALADRVKPENQPTVAERSESHAKADTSSPESGSTETKGKTAASGAVKKRAGGSGKKSKPADDQQGSLF